MVNVSVRRPGGGLHIYAENVSRGIWITVNSRTTATWSSSFSSTTMRGRSARVHLDVNSLPNLRQLANAKSVRPNPESSSVFSSSKTTVPRIRNLHPPSLNNVSYALTPFGADFPIVQMNFRPCSLEKWRVLYPTRCSLYDFFAFIWFLFRCDLRVAGILIAASFQESQSPVHDRFTVLRVF